ncbi:hypothetical protein [Devosia marina]|uniref:Uncharacterized protein n=1 Tax=Devosia marina TaxID=2683198 RepID=A0A7X3FNU3_9HYPH|nr:hypothetical protein [Devosia marina]MVS97888.1 hypothetical protein [Devosia marina]
MCTPLIVAGLALTAGSMVANSVAQSQIDTARNDVLHAELSRQQGYDAQINDLNTQSQDRFVDWEGQQDARADDLASMFASSVDDPNMSAMLPTSASNIVNNETAKRKADAQEFVDQQSGALANMRSFGDLLGETSLLQGRDTAKVGQLGGFKIGSQGLVPYELDEANRAGDGAKFFGDLLRLGGTVATGAGIGGGSIASMFGQGSTGFVPGLTGPSLGLPANLYYGV